MKRRVRKYRYRGRANNHLSLRQKYKEGGGGEWRGVEGSGVKPSEVRSRTRHEGIKRREKETKVVQYNHKRPKVLH